MNTPKFLIADPCYILDKETWQSFCDKATDTADEEFEGSWIEAFKDALARYIHRYYKMKMYEYEITRKIGEIINEIVKEIKNEN